MTDEILQASTTIQAPAETVFAVLANPANHAAIDGTGWVTDPLDGELITGEGQIFRMGMFHQNHPDGTYEMANRVDAFDPPRAISWEPGQYSAESGELETGGWTWRYDLDAAGPGETRVTLTYDWSAVPPPIRKEIPFPPFAPEHLDHSLKHLAALAQS